jgi:excisionase family DNA binding protein
MLFIMVELKMIRETEALTFEKLPEAVGLLLEKVARIESLLEGQQYSFSEQDDLITIKQASKLLDLAIPTLYSKVSRKEIPVNKQGKRLYFYKSELQDWIRQGRKRTSAEIRENAQISKSARSKS